MKTLITLWNWILRVVFRRKTRKLVKPASTPSTFILDGIEQRATKRRRLSHHQQFGTFSPVKPLVKK